MNHLAQKFLISALLCCLAAVSAPALASPFSDDLAKCLVRSTTPADKRFLAKWLFSAAALHPEIESIASVSAEQRLALDKGMAQMLERLLFESCRNESQQSLKYDGRSAFTSSFEVLGRVAGQVLFSDPRVAPAMQGFMQHLDIKKMQEWAAADK
ncbi:MAG: hypothetical protein ACKVOO_04375 [Burkholderiaceae bacterium]